MPRQPSVSGAGKLGLVEPHRVSAPVVQRDCASLADRTWESGTLPHLSMVPAKELLTMQTGAHGSEEAL